MGVFVAAAVVVAVVVSDSVVSELLRAVKFNATKFL